MKSRKSIGCAVKQIKSIEDATVLCLQIELQPFVCNVYSRLRYKIQTCWIGVRYKMVLHRMPNECVCALHTSTSVESE